LTFELVLQSNTLAANLPALWWLPLSAYLLGSIPFGYLIVAIGAGGDIRHMGSGNIGATNVAREVGSLPGVLTLLLDAAKGYLAVWIAARVTGGNVRWMMLAAVLAIVGHLFPVWLGFHGGKGVATGVGVFLPFCWEAVLISFIVWLLVVLFWRYVSLASISATAALPLVLYLLYAPPHAPPIAVTSSSLLIMALIIMRHKPNIMRLLAGTEPRFTRRRENDGE
jgi:glycerol-3-phosphate acyltransferase PlsY